MLISFLPLTAQWWQIRKLKHSIERTRVPLNSTENQRKQRFWKVPRSTTTLKMKLKIAEPKFKRMGLKAFASKGATETDKETLPRKQK